MRRRHVEVTTSTGAAFLVALALVSLSIFAVLYVVDHMTIRPFPWPWQQLDSQTAAAAIANMAEVTVGILGVAITVVSIIVELAATRYTQRIAELFMRDRTNITALSFFVVTSVLVVWINLGLGDGPVPKTMVIVELVLVSVSLLALLPYFAYVFDFLSPTAVVRRIGEQARQALRYATRGGEPDGPREVVARALEHLGDIASKAIQNEDKAIAIAATNELARVVEASLAVKADLPDTWFDAYEFLKTDADFVSFHRDVLRRLVARRTWVEMKALRQYQSAFGETVLDQRDVGHLIAIQARRLAVKAGEADDREALRLVLRFLNTFSRQAINARDVRSAYNLLNEYRLLAQGLVGTPAQAMLLDVAEFIKVYGQLGFRSNLSFILETAAYDLCSLAEVVHAAGAGEHDALLDVVLDVDREPDDSAMQEAALRGVRKAQVKLATYYLVNGEEPLARRIQRDMGHESASRLRGIRQELERTVDEEFWEIADRGANFDWLDPERRARLAEFFGWFATSPLAAG